MNQVSFSPMVPGTEARFTHTIQPDGAMKNDFCRGCVYDVSVGVVTGPHGITRAQYNTIKRMEGMALLLSPTVDILFRDGLGEAIAALEDMVPCRMACIRQAA
ncbi:hypothetical protein [Jiella pelagia]|uniref:Uncharacterized protein n=1 Tax=Jiella pelagia TaxID=2986949 RepID=A0ABY7BZX6_9HYPH|nr:hypothetical protein [Jiella pelagia]WAP69071.1 hypothetical protein OH818_01670 [Jiella pelagia]